MYIIYIYYTYVFVCVYIYNIYISCMYILYTIGLHQHVQCMAVKAVMISPETLRNKCFLIWA